MEERSSVYILWQASSLNKRRNIFCMKPNRQAFSQLTRLPKWYFWWPFNKNQCRSMHIQTNAAPQFTVILLYLYLWNCHNEYQPKSESTLLLMYMNKLKNNKLLQNLDVEENKRAREQDIKKVVDWKSTRAREWETNLAREQEK